MKFIKVTTLLFTSLLIFFSCRNPLSNDVVNTDFELGKEFQLKFGKASYNTEERLTIQFTDLLEEGRCPEDVMCVWAGNSKINLKTTINGVSRNLELDTHSDMQTEVEFKGYILELVVLKPYPKSADQSISEEEYIATILIGREE